MFNLFYILLGLAPSFIWLSFYLRKDVHPEPKRKVLEIFFLGMVVAFLAVGAETLIFAGILNLSLPKVLSQILYSFFGIALIEEFLKYLVVKFRVFKDPEFDEPLDIMLYMIIAALGLAGLENMFLLFSKNLQFWETFLISGLRFISATFLHALCSGLFGFFIALSFSKHRKRKAMPLAGLTIAAFLHGLYNFSIMGIEGNLRFLIPVFILGSLAIFVSWGFKKLKKMTSTCKINE